MKYIFLFSGLALLALRFLFYHQAQTLLRRAHVVKAKVISARYTDFGGWWIEAEYRLHEQIRNGHLLAGRRKYAPGDKLECLLLQNERLIRTEDAGKLSKGKGLLLPAIFLLLVSMFLFFIPDIDLWKFALLSALCLSFLVILRWGFLSSLIEMIRGDRVAVVISDVKVLKGLKYFFEYEFSDRFGQKVAVMGQPNLIRQVSIEYLRCRIGTKAKVRIDRKTGAVYESSAVGMVLSMLAAVMCFLAIIFIFLA